MGSLSLKSPNFWVILSIFLAVPGMIAGALGWTTGHCWLKVVGMILFAPFAIAVFVLIVIVFPVLIVANHRQRNNPPPDRKDP
jgi:hypothetical protein